MNEKKATPNIEPAPKELGPESTAPITNPGDNSVAAQRARVLELKRRGFEILTQWVHDPTDCGKLHRVALYVLLRETGGQA